MSDDMRREEERKKWEQTAIEDLQNEVHYENLRFGGTVRQPFNKSLTVVEQLCFVTGVAKINFINANLLRNNSKF